MNKREFLKTSGILSLASLIPLADSIAEISNTEVTGSSCVLIPTEMAGPFPLDLTANTYYFRQDIRESKPGTPLNVKLKIIGDGNCAPMQNVRVNIWQCDHEGNYSGYDNSMNPGQAGLTYLRGYQITDAKGEVNFITNFPGWYPGRVCHIHFQVYVSSAYSASSQLTFDHIKVNAVYAENTTVYKKGNDPLTPATDGIFQDGYTYQVASLDKNNSGGYDSYLEITVKGSGVITGYMERENARHFSMEQNFPNPYFDDTTIPFSLTESSEVTIVLYDLTGKNRATVFSRSLGPGEHEVVVEPRSWGLEAGNYIYQIEVTNSKGTFKDCKMMTAGR